jgi:hypothetical protein
VNDFEDFDPSNYEPSAAQPVEHYGVEKPDRWYADNAAVFHALEEWQRRWQEFCEKYEAENDRRPSSYTRDKNKAAFRRTLCERYGRGEPDKEWLAARIAWMERRGAAPTEGGMRR